MQKGLNKLARRLGIKFSHKEMVNDLYKLVADDLYHAEGVQGATIRWWRNRFESNAIICNLDKRKQDVVVVCPRCWQFESMKWFKDQDVERICPDNDGVIKIEFRDDVNEKINNMRSTLS